MESISCGTPVIGSRIGGIPELIEEGKTGELFTPGDVKSLIAKIEELWSDEDKLTKYVKACRKKEFDTVETYCRKLMEMIEQI